MMKIIITFINRYLLQRVSEKSQEHLEYIKQVHMLLEKQKLSKMSKH